jgi:mannose/fructose/N-acetylgalactosamine-specific phosphotransferase system component IID
MKLQKRKGSSLTGSTGGGTLKKLLEGSTIVDLLTIGVLIYDFMLLKNTGYGTTNLFQFPSSQEILAAQLTGLVVAIYIIEAVIDSAGD